MAIVIGQHILINKHIPHGRSRRSSRKYFNPADFDDQRELAKQYAADKGEDYLICLVVEEISAPSGSKSKRKIIHKENSMVQPDFIEDSADNKVKANTLHIGDLVIYDDKRRMIRSISKGEELTRIIFEGVKQLDVTIASDTMIEVVSRNPKFKN